MLGRREILGIAACLCLLPGSCIAKESRLALVKGCGGPFVAARAGNGDRVEEAFLIALREPCTGVGDAPCDQCAFLATGGECSLAEKARVAERLGARAVIDVVKGGEGQKEGDDDDDGLPGRTDGVSALRVSASAGAELAGRTKAKGCSISASEYDPPPLDPSAAILALFAVLPPAASAAWVFSDEKRRFQSGGSANFNHGKATQEERTFVHALSVKQACLVIAAASCSLLLLFLLARTGLLWYVMAVLFCISGCSAAVDESRALFNSFVPGVSAHALADSLSLHSFAIALLEQAVLGVALSAVLFSVPVEGGGWVAQDLLGIIFLTGALRIVRVPSFRVATLLLSLALTYDVFFVFLEPALFGGDSIMVQVATGGDGRPLPGLFLVPRLLDPVNGLAGIGFGDAFLPGVVVVLGSVADAASGKRRPLRVGGYGFAGLAGMICGVGGTFVGMATRIGGSHAQPALLYLAPAVLLAFGASALVKGEAGTVWRDARGLHAPSTSGDDASPQAEVGQDGGNEESCLLSSQQASHGSPAQRDALQS